MPKQNIMAVLETKRAVSLLLTPTFVQGLAIALSTNIFSTSALIASI
jgi:hypothetical protein